jgi:hypothetical protein
MKNGQTLAVSLPFERRESRQIKANVIEISNTAESVNAKPRLSRQHSATSSNNMEALC